MRILNKFRWVRSDPYWSKLERKGERCNGCGFPAAEAPNGKWCPYCGYPDNPDGLSSIVVG